MPEFRGMGVARVRRPIAIVRELPEEDEDAPNMGAEINRLRERMGRSSPARQIIDTIGFEYETIALSRSKVEGILYRNRSLEFSTGLISITRDASSESKYYTIPVGDKCLIDVNSHSDFARKLFGNNRRLNTFGVELITKPLEKDTMGNLIDYVLPALENGGDFVSERCATHVHIGMSNNVDILKSALSFGLWADELFFSLAGMRGNYRGTKNNSIYSRPLISGPFVKINRGNYYQVGNWRTALGADDIYKFFAAYHIDIERGLPSKYVPARYFALNLLSMVLIGTLEFRYFNQSLNPRDVKAIINLCQASAEIIYRGAASKLRSLEVGDPFTYQSPNYYIRKLESLVSLSKEIGAKHSLENDSIVALNSMIEYNSPFNIGEKEVKTHVKDYSANQALVVMGNLNKSTKTPAMPGNVDIHNIDLQSIF